MNCCVDTGNCDIKKEMRNLLGFCSILIDEMIANYALKRCPTTEEYVYFSRQYNKLSDNLKELGVVL